MPEAHEYLIFLRKAIIGGSDAITFEAFIVRKLVPKLWKAVCVVMDNCPIHLGKK